MGFRRRCNPFGAIVEVISRTQHQTSQDKRYQGDRYRAGPAQAQQLDDSPNYDAGDNRIWDGEPQCLRPQRVQIAEDHEFIGEADQEPADEAP